VKRTGIILAGAAMVTHVTLAAVGHPSILCIEADGRVAFEDGSASCCDVPGAADLPYRPAALPSLTMGGTEGLPCEDCVDIELPLDTSFQGPPAPLDVKTLSAVALELPPRIAGSSPPDPALRRPTKSFDPGDLALTALRTVFLRC
jgi:hypothetical protein